MADKQDTVYNTRKLSKFFAFASLALLFAVVWAVIEDYDRDWKRYTRQMHKIQAAIGERKLRQVNKAMDNSKLEGLQKQIAELEKKDQEMEAQLTKKVDARAAIYYKANQDYQFKKAELDALSFELEHAIKELKPKAAHLKQEYAELAATVKALKVKADEAEKNRDRALEDDLDFLSARKKLKDDLSSMTIDRDRLKKQIFQNESNLLNIARNAPVVDFMAPSVKITQVVTPYLKDDYFFNKVPRVDRCMTCHATIDKAGFENYPQPFKSHPKLKLMVSEDSPHPMSKMACTVCHAGAGQSVDFTLAGHTPKDIQQEHEWESKYHYHLSHHIGTPMVPTPMTEGKCLQCHAKQSELGPDAPTFNSGMKLIAQAGCYGCHKFSGGPFETLSKEKAVGPALTKIASKVSPEWIQKWLWDPQSFRPSTMMPRFWKLHNNSDPASLARGAVEVEAITHFLTKKSLPYEPAKLASSAAADIERGKKIVGSVGCLGCHAVADFPRENPKDVKALGFKDPRVPMFGPELNQMGSKVSKEWLVSWLVNPKHYWEKSNMPSLKLSVNEASDVAAYLLSKRNPVFEALKAPTPNDKLRDEIIAKTFESTMSPTEAQAKLASMSLDDRKMYLGEKMVGHYGCYGCHAIAGFENAPKIGPELSVEGSKDLSKFAFENVEAARHTRAGWIYTKIRTPRIWDVGKNRDFEAKTRMPQFPFSSEQATAVTAVILGHENKNVEDAAIFKVDGRWEQIIRGQSLILQKNCVGCHAIEQKGGEILAHFEDQTMGPPNLNTEGKKVQTEWLYRFLMNPNVVIRPWLNVRMPQYHFDDAQVIEISKYFAAVDKASYPFDLKAGALTAAERSAAATIVEKHACLSCHAVRKPGEDVSAAAPHFQNIKARLRAPWVSEWLHDPSKIMPGTRMPTLWPLVDDNDPKKGRIAVDGILGDDAEKQISVVRDYLYQYGGPAELPSLRSDAKLSFGGQVSAGAPNEATPESAAPATAPAKKPAKKK